MRYIASGDNVELAVETIGAGPPLIFAHGLTSHLQVTRMELAPLADRYRLILFDQRGHGASTPITDPALYDPQRMADDIGAVLDSLDIERAIVGGESMGAATALTFALKHPNRVEQLLLTAPAFGDSANSERERLVQMSEDLARVGMEAFLALAAERQRVEFNWTPDLIAFVADMLSAHDPASLATALKAVAHWAPFTDPSVVAQLARPVCIVAWEQDPLHPIELARCLAATLPDAKLRMMAPLPALFRDPAQVGRMYGEFLEAR